MRIDAAVGPFLHSFKEHQMVKKLKAMAGSAGSDSHLAAAIKDSAQQIWLAGLGAFAKAQEEGQKVFGALVKEGNAIQKRTMKVTEDKVNEVSTNVAKIAGQFQKQASGTMSSLEGLFEQRVERALGRLGVPSSKEVAELTKKVEHLTAAVNKLSGGRAVKSAKRATKSA
jgi:poly(hydroxyalkanoate) granule-associated protein